MAVKPTWRQWQERPAGGRPRVGLPGGVRASRADHQRSVRVPCHHAPLGDPDRRTAQVVRGQSLPARHRPGHPVRHRVRPARSQRRRQDDRDQYPHHPARPRRWHRSRRRLRRRHRSGQGPRLSDDDLAAVAAALNSRPRRTLGWRNPA